MPALWLTLLSAQGVGRHELIKRVGWLREAIEARGGRVAEFAGMEIDAVVDRCVEIPPKSRVPVAHPLRRALAVLKDLIGEHEDLIEPTFFPLDRFQLSFYRNQVRRSTLPRERC